MSKSRGKRPGLRARSKNSRSTKPLRVGTALHKQLAKDFAPGASWSRPAMYFYGIDEGTPAEGAMLLVRLRDNTYRYGMVLKGFFANYDHHREEYVTMAHPERITHWMQIMGPIAFPMAKEEAQTPQAQAPKCVDEAIHDAAGDVEADFQSQGEVPDRAEDVYA